MSKNPFEASLIKDFFMEDPCENLDIFMRDIREANRYARCCANLPHHQFLNWLVSFLPKRVNKIDYYENYIGVDRRKSGKMRKIVDGGVAAFKVALMTKTEKIKPLKEA